MSIVTIKIRNANMENNLIIEIKVALLACSLHHIDQSYIKKLLTLNI